MPSRSHHRNSSVSSISSACIARRARAGGLDQLGHPVGHRLEVADRGLDVHQYDPDASLELRKLLRRQVPADLEVHDRLPDFRLPRVAHLHDAALAVALDPDHRVDDESDLEAPCAELLRDRVDQERHVLGVRLDDRADGRVPVSGESGIEHANGERCNAAAVGELEQAHDLAEELLGIESLGDVRRDAPDVGAGELPDRLDPVRGDALADACEQRIEQPALSRAGGGGFGRAAHLCAPGSAVLLTASDRRPSPRTPRRSGRSPRRCGSRRASTPPRAPGSCRCRGSCCRARRGRRDRHPGSP